MPGETFGVFPGLFIIIRCSDNPPGLMQKAYAQESSDATAEVSPSISASLREFFEPDPGMLPPPGALEFYSLSLLAVAIFVIVLAMRVGLARIKHKVNPPAMTGPPAFEHASRIYQNTIEQLILFMIVLVVFTTASGWIAAGIATILWLLARIVYAVGYSYSPGGRMLGFVLGVSIVAVMILWSALVFGTRLFLILTSSP